MKTRFLSLLLLVAMIVTALPLAALPVIATEVESVPREYDFAEEDYNALYVKDGLVFAVDFFRMNEWWNTEGIEYTVPLGPSENPAYEYGGNTYNFRDNAAHRYGWGVVTKGETTSKNQWYNGTVYATEAEAQAVIDAMPEADRSGYMVLERPTEAFMAAHNEWAAQDQAFLKQFMQTANSPATAFSYNPSFGATCTEFYNIASMNTTKDFSVFTVDNGFIRMRPDHHSSGGLQFTLTTPANYMTDNLSLQVVCAFSGAEMASKSIFLIMNNIRPQFTADANGIYFQEPKADNFTFSSLTPGDVTLPNKEGVGVSMTVTLEGYKDSDADDAILIRTPNGTAATIAGQLNYTNSSTGNHYIGFSRNPREQRVYAYRYYNAELTEAELKQNHFADLAKFFRLDLTYFKSLTPAQMEVLYTEAAKHSVTSDRETVKEALYALARDFCRDAYLDMYGDAFDAEVAAIAAEYFLDLSMVMNAPRAVFSDTWTFLLSGYKTSDDVAADYAAAIKRDLQAYADAPQATADYYNSLYVQENLKYALDFFYSNAFWDGVGVTYTAADAEAYKKATQETAVWHDTGKPLAFGSLSDTYSATIANGYFDPTNTKDGYSIGDPTAIASYNNFSAEYVMQVGTPKSQGGILINNHRLYFSLEGALKEIHIQSDFKILNNYPTYGGKKVVTSALNGPVTLAYAYRFDTPTLSESWTAVYHTGDASIDNGSVRIGRYVTVEGEAEPVLSVSSNSITNAAFANRKFYWPAAPKKMTAQYIDGKKQAAPAEYMVVLETECQVDGALALYENGKTLYENDGVKFLNNKLGYSSTLVNWSSIRNYIYAIRYYDGMLTEEQNAQNHFVDIAKWYRLNLAGYELLDADAKAELYALVADVPFAERGRFEVQKLVLDFLTPHLAAAYDEFKNEDATHNALVELATDYFLDLSGLMSAGRDVTTVYERVTAGALAGMRTGEAQALLDDALFDAYHYYSFRTEDSAWNAYLAALADEAARPNADALMALPQEMRLRAAEGNLLTQEAIDAFVKEAKRAYYGKYTEEEYEALYVHDQLALAFDFFRTNEYWGGKEIVFTANAPRSSYDPFIWERDGNICIQGGLGAIRDGYYDVPLTSGSADPRMEILVYSSPMLMAADSFTGDYVWKFEQKNTGTQIYMRRFWINTSGSTYNPETGATINFQTIYNQQNRYNYDDWTKTWGNHYAKLHTFGNVKYVAGHRAAQLTYVWQDMSGYFTSAAGTENPILTVYAAELPNALITVDTLAGGELILNNKDYYRDNEALGKTDQGGAKGEYQTNEVDADGNPVYDSGSKPLGGSLDNYKEGFYGLGEITPTPIDMVGYNGTFDGRVYAMRYYAKALTQAESLQNHFADLAKFFRLDIGDYLLLDAPARATVHTAMRGLDLAMSTRDEVVAAYGAAVNAALGDAALATLPEDFRTLATENDVPLAKLFAIHEAAGRNAIAATFTATHAVAYVSDAEVLTAELREAMRFLDSIDFFGTQVRVSTVEKVTDKLNPGDMPGIRQIFKIGEAELYDLVKANGTVTFGATIHGESVNDTTLTFTATLEGEELKITGGNTTTLTYGDEDFRAFVYTVTYDGFESYEPAVAEELYSTELSYRFFLTVGGLTYTRDAVHSIFGDAISATEVYQHFYDNSEELTPPNWGVSFAEDKIVQSVLGIPQA